MKSPSFENPVAVSPEKWLAARLELQKQEKELTRARTKLAAQRRALPWTKVTKNYVFTTPTGPMTLAELFGEQRQLIVYHFMLAPGWEEGCRGCSFVSDHVDGALPHIQARNIAFTAVSRAPLDEIQRFKARMGWHFDWVSSHGTDFNRDFGVTFTDAEVEGGEAVYNFGQTTPKIDEMPGVSVFARGTDGNVYRTYSTYSRGLESLIGAYSFIDLVPLGRDEDPEMPMSWIRHHDRYDHAVAST